MAAIQHEFLFGHLSRPSCWSITKHFSGIEGEVDFLPDIIVVGAQHRIRLADQNGARGAVAQRGEPRASAAGGDLRAVRQRAVPLEADPDRDLGLFGVLGGGPEGPLRNSPS
ncbi:MAG: hypothetical protein ACR2K5_13200, partial [Pseudolabrys sp.]